MSDTTRRDTEGANHPPGGTGRIRSFVRRRPLWQIVLAFLIIQFMELVVTGAIGGYVSVRLKKGHDKPNMAESAPPSDEAQHAMQGESNFTPAPKRKTKHCWRDADDTPICAYK